MFDCMCNSIQTTRVQCGTRELESKVTLTKVVNDDSATIPTYRVDSALNSTGGLTRGTHWVG